MHIRLHLKNGEIINIYNNQFENDNSIIYTLTQTDSKYISARVFKNLVEDHDKDVMTYINTDHIIYFEVVEEKYDIEGSE